MTKVLHIALNDKKVGDSAEAKLLHDELMKTNVSSELWVLEKFSQDKNIFLIDTNKNQNRKILTKSNIEQIFGSRTANDFDIIHIHGMGRNIYPSLLNNFKTKRLLWSLDNCAPYTGSCSHSAHCDQWMINSPDACSRCPIYADDILGQRRQADLYQQRKNLYKKMKIEFLCSNSWQKKQIDISIAAEQTAIVWQQMIDRENFHLGNKKSSRKNLGLPENAFIIVFPTDLSEGKNKVLEYTQKALSQIRDYYTGYMVLINLGCHDLDRSWPVDEIRNVDFGNDGYLLGNYYRAADLQLYFSGIDSSYNMVREAGHCGLPSVLFDIGAANEIIAKESGFVIPPFDIEELAKILLTSMRDAKYLTKKGMNFYVELQSQKRGTNEYQQIYLNKGKLKPNLEENFDEIFKSGNDAIKIFIEKKLCLWQVQEEDTQQQKQKKEQQQHIFVDKFCTAWLDTISVNDSEAIWKLILIWQEFRRPQVINGFSGEEEISVHILFCRNLRDFLVKYFQKKSLEEFSSLLPTSVDAMARLWYFVFLNTEAAINRAAEKFECPENLLKQEKTEYPTFLIWSMFVPYMSEIEHININKLMTENLPIPLRVVTAFWLITAPFFGGSEKQRQTVLSYIEEMCVFMIKRPAYISAGMCQMLMDKIMVSLWRLSYLGGNNISALHAYGDFLQYYVAQKYSEFTKTIKLRHRKKNVPLRIGYASMNFRSQAVSRYMANRIKFHDKKRFFVKTFILGKDKGDAMTENIRKWSDEYEDIIITDMQSVTKAARSIKQSNLDMIIYADIGMNNMTYLLGAMHLAPIQSVLVGHGTTTGLTTIDYYISGDHEPKDAQKHYTEKLIRLPNAGAAQLPPDKSERALTRGEFGIPDDAVLFISCANGLKHVAARDDILIEILRQAPNAYILLKPYMSPNTIDWKFKNRIMLKAKAAGVEKRMVIIPPLPQSGDLMALINLADVQLDTYPYGGWTTNLEALYYHLPIVTQQGDMARSRWGAGLLNAMGIYEGVAKTEEEYINWAVRFAKDCELRRNISEKIAQKGPEIIFNGKAAQPAYEDALIQMIAEKEGQVRRG